jgi:3D-(3,5/4)-trihydroxycyclohexane-1,2-dione acylhydrolase (decyclizing)
MNDRNEVIMSIANEQNPLELARMRTLRAQALAQAGGIHHALQSGVLPQFIDTTLSEALILGLLLQDVHVFIGVFGHGSTEIGEVLRIYHRAGLLRVFQVRSEIEASHAAAALRWVRGEKAAVFTSIGPGALQALAASIMPASDGLGVYYLCGDETSEDEGFNMQQIPRAVQGSFLKLYSQMGQAYSLHTPLALGTALRRALNTVDHPYRPGPFFFLLPMNTQCAPLPQFNLRELPWGSPPALGPAHGEDRYQQAAQAILAAKRVVVKFGGGAAKAGPQLAELLDLADAVAIHNPIVPGVLPYSNPRNMTVGGSKGSISGNYAMDNADLLIAVGMRFVCQSDCSRTGFPQVTQVININAGVEDAMHYNDTLALVGDAALTIQKLNEALRLLGSKKPHSGWFEACTKKRAEWEAYKQKRYQTPVLYDEAWKREVLTQPAAIKAICDWAKANDAIQFYDAGDVQANGFQIEEEDHPGRIFTDSGASYMGFAVSALLSTAIAHTSFYALAVSGDGSLTMNPQILIDGVEHGVNGCILVLDNRRMAAISGLQTAQYGHDFATWDNVAVDYVAWARAIQGIQPIFGGYTTQTLVAALDQARAYHGLSLIHVPVYYGENELGGMGVYGRWNVGNWTAQTQMLRHRIGL